MSLNYGKIEVVIHESPLKRRFLRFVYLDRGLVLDHDADQERASNRHKFVSVRYWDRLNSRDSNLERREVPSVAIDEALRLAREKVVYVEE